MSPNDSSETDTGRDEHEGGVPFFPDHFVKEAAVMALVLGIVLFLATLMPAPMGEPADPLKTPAGIRPEWYFLSVYQILKYVPKNVGIILTFIIFPPVLMLFPMFYKTITTWRYGRLAMHTLVALGIFFSVFLSSLAYLGFE
jgi:quinol-cytochrome oxidoreductase complex cytochrome b subunit